MLVIVTLGLGIAATTTMFSVVWAVFLRPLPFPEPDRLVTIWESDPPHGEMQRRVTPANFADWEAQTRSFDAVGVLPNWTGAAWPFNVVHADGIERVQGIYASSGFFKTLGIAPMLGRTLGPDDDRTRGRRNVVISHPYWLSRFRGDPAVVGRPLTIDTFRGGAFTIVGVMPEEFDFPRGASVWLSLGDWGGGPMPAPDDVNRCCAWYATFGRLKRDVTIESAASELTTIARRVSAKYPAAARVSEVRVVPLRGTLVGRHEQTLFGFLGAVACILLIACANVANLILSRGVGRRREVLTRLALGATRWRIAQQLLAESLLLGAIGAALGLLVSLWAQDVLSSALADRVPLIESTRLDLPVFAFAILLTVATSVLCGLSPLAAWRGLAWNVRLQTENPTSRRLRHALVVGEIALAVTLVASAGLLLRTVAKLRAVDVGFETARTLIVSTDLTTAPLRARGTAAAFIEQLMPRLQGIEGIRVVAAATGVPFDGGLAEQAITRREDPPRPASASPHVVQTAVTPGYFDAMGITLRRGRFFDPTDKADGELVAVINETAARRYWPGQDPIGRRFAIGSLERFGSFRQVKPGEVEWRTIVGVVADVRSRGFAVDVQPEVFYNYKQFPLYDPALVVRASRDRPSMIADIRRTVAAVNPNAVLTRVRTLEDVADESIADERLRATLTTIFSGLALSLGMLGVYGVMTYTVASRTREIGIRMALGARRVEVARLVMGAALRMTLAGLVLGLGAAYVIARSLSTLFFGIAPFDVPTLAATCTLLLSAAVFASAWPARHAVRVEPAIALRNE